MSVCIGNLLKETKERLDPIAMEDAAYEARVLLAHVLGCEVGYLPAYHDKVLTGSQRDKLERLLTRREAHEPLQYVLGTWNFMGLEFEVRPGVLIPRADTEVLVEAALDLAKARKYETVLDMCCGSGCIGISMAALGDLYVTSVDIEDICIESTMENADKNDVNVAVVKSDMFKNIVGKYDMILCNPPYLNAKDMESLQAEVKYEPAIALFGGDDGLDFYRRIAEQYEKYLKDTGVLLLEVGASQSRDVCRLFGGFCTIIEDFSGISRVIAVQGATHRSQIRCDC